MARLKLRTGSGAPTAAAVLSSEPCWDATNGSLYIKNASDMVPIGTIAYASTNSFPATGSPNTIYLARDTGKAYGWFDTVYGEIGSAGTLLSMAVQVATPVAGAVTITPDDIYSGTVTLTLTANATVTLPAATTARRFDVYVIQDAVGSWTPTFTSTSTITWPTGTTQMQWVKAASTFSVLTFISNGTQWYAHVAMEPRTMCDIVNWL